MKCILAVALVLLAGPAWADMFQDAGNAKLPEAQRNLGQMASITPQMRGATGDGLADDTSSVQVWLSELKTGQYVGNCQGKFRLTASVNAFPEKPYRVVGAGQGDRGCNFYIDYNSNWAGNAIDLTNPTTPTTRGPGADWSSLTITYNPALTSPPRAIGGDYLSDSLFRDIVVSQFTAGRGSCVTLGTPWNIRQFKNISVWGCGGHASSKLVPAGTTFSITGATSTLASSAAFFEAGDVGRYITCQGTPYPEAWKITGYTGPTAVTVGRAASATHTNVLCAMNGITGSIAAGSPTLTISAANLTSADVGRIVYVPTAGITVLGNGKNALRTTITAVSGTTVTLADNATNAATGVPVILSPAVEIIAANDVVFDTLNLAFNGGTPLVMKDSTIARLVNTKTHALNSGDTFGQTNVETDFNAAFFWSQPIVEATDIEGTAVSGLGRVLISGSQPGLIIGSVTGILTTGLPQYALIANDVNSGFSFGPIVSSGRVAPAWLTAANLVYNDGTSTYGALTLGPVVSFNSGPPMPMYIRP